MKKVTQGDDWGEKNIYIKIQISIWRLDMKAGIHHPNP
jgi:hypothetical protein